MPVTPCLSCGRLSTGSYCPAHRPSRSGAPRGSGQQMVNFRRQVKARTGGRCARCGSTQDVEAHHLQPLAAGGSNDPANGVALCRDCHDDAHRALSYQSARARQNGQRPERRARRSTRFTGSR